MRLDRQKRGDEVKKRRSKRHRTAYYAVGHAFIHYLVTSLTVRYGLPAISLIPKRRLLLTACTIT